MAIDFCALCADLCAGKNTIIGNNNMQEVWRTLVAQALCQIATNTGGSSSSTSTLLPEVIVAAEDVPAAYADIDILDSENKFSILTINNASNGDVTIRADGETDPFITVFANSVETINLGNRPFIGTGPLEWQSVSGNEPTEGEIIFQGSY